MIRIRAPLSRSPEALDEGWMKKSARPPSMNLEWTRPAAGSVAAAPADLRRRATVALVINLVVAVGLFGLLSIPGAITAGLARGAAEQDPERAARLIRWSWAFLATNLLFYLLLLAVVLVVAAYLYLISRSGT
jgi:hypothetical protein